MKNVKEKKVVPVEATETEPEVVEAEVVEETEAPQQEKKERKGIPGWAKLLGGVGIGVAAAAIIGGLFHKDDYDLPPLEGYDPDDSEDDSDEDSEDEDDDSTDN